MEIRYVDASSPQCLRVGFSNGSEADYNLFALCDSHPSGFDPQTQERIFDLLSVPDDLCISRAQVSADGDVEVVWAHDSSCKVFTAQWLYAHRPGQNRTDAVAQIAPTLWEGKGLPREPLQHNATAILQSDAALYAWLQDLVRYGLTLVRDMPEESDICLRVAERVGFLRTTNFGHSFDVVSMADPNNLAYTSAALPLHIDLPNQEMPPGVQFLHCIANTAQGGESLFADGFAICNALREQDPEAFVVLAQTPVPFRFHDNSADIRTREPVIGLDSKGSLRELRYNAHIVDCIDLNLSEQACWYPAYRQLMRLMRSSQYRVTHTLQAGEMVCFDNRRVLHGRGAFNSATGQRRLQGCYVDRGELYSRLRLLAATVKQTQQ